METEMADNPLFIVILLVCFGVVVILAMGLGSFDKGDKDSAIRSNKMMRYRIIAQAVAVALIALFVFLSSNGGGSN